MKRISIIIAAAFAAMLSASCSKSIETPAAPSPGESIILDLSIAGFDGAGETKAVKTGWAAGDKLNLWFDDWNNTEKADNPIPDLVITYDGSKWTAGALAAGRSLRPSGEFLAVYEGSNNLSDIATITIVEACGLIPITSSCLLSLIMQKPILGNCLISRRGLPTLMTATS